MGSVVAKFFVQSIIPRNAPKGAAAQITMGAVCRGVENASWSAATPSGSIQMNILNDAATAQFEEGAEYLVTFNKVAKPAPNDGHAVQPVTDKHKNLVCVTCGLHLGPASGGTPTVSAMEVHDTHYAALP